MRQEGGRRTFGTDQSYKDGGKKKKHFILLGGKEIRRGGGQQAASPIKEKEGIEGKRQKDLIHFFGPGKKKRKVKQTRAMGGKTLGKRVKRPKWGTGKKGGRKSVRPVGATKSLFQKDLVKTKTENKSGEKKGEPAIFKRGRAKRCLTRGKEPYQTDLEGGAQN